MVILLAVFMFFLATGLGVASFFIAGEASRIRKNRIEAQKLLGYDWRGKPVKQEHPELSPVERNTLVGKLLLGD